MSSALIAGSRERDQLLHEWVAEQAGPFALDPNSLAPASADASFRRYFRVASSAHGSLIVMDAPPAQEDVGPFLHARDVFAQTGVHVPAVHFADRERGFLLLEDFGGTHYLAAIRSSASQLDAPARADALYRPALSALVRLQAHGRTDAFAPYDAALLRRELELFREWYCGRHLGVTLSDAQHQALDRVFALLIANNIAQPQVVVHRDYHSRNLMVLDDARRSPGILDFQDAVTGPVTYDLVSLLRDAYVRWDEEQVLDWAVRYWEQARRDGVPIQADFGEFYRDFEWMGLQRHLKVLGIFARLKHRDGKDGYVNDMPLVMAYTRACAERYSAFGPLVQLLDELEGRETPAGYTF
ncbi:MAG TPA: phosphotransferase [Burkholderiaceae bacterium]|nr:phosphotransferase [Burkholderiaceae bacterium]